MCHGGEGNGRRKRQSPHSQAAGNCAAESVPGTGESRRAPSSP